MQISVSDRMTFGDRQTTADGYLATVCKLSRSGCYEYLGSELGRPDMPTVTVYRDEADVFDEASLRSFAYKPVTDDHPPVGVNSKNWSKYAKGQLGGKALRDGDHIEFPLVIMDQGLIDKINSGKSDVSAGYTASIEFVDGIAPDGTPYQAKMTDIIGNHCAVVDRGRAITARLGDAWPTEDTSAPTPPKSPVKDTKLPHIMHDGLKIDLTDAEAVSALVIKLTDTAAKAAADRDTAAKALTDAEVAHASAIKDANAAKDKAEAEAASAVKALADAKTTPEQLRDAAKAYSALVDSAGKIAPAFTITDAMSDADIRKGVVLTVFGDTYKDKSETFFDALFEVEAAKVVDGKSATTTDPFRDAMANRPIADFSDAATKAADARKAMIDGFNKPRAETK